MKLNVPPTPIITGTSSRAALRPIHSSCLGLPSATNRRSGFAALIRSTISGWSSSSFTNAGSSPATFTGGNLANASSNTSRAPPRTYTESPSSAKRRQMAGTMSAPVTRSGSGSRSIFESSTIGMPSAVTRSAFFR